MEKIKVKGKLKTVPDTNIIKIFKGAEDLFHSREKKFDEIYN